MGSSPLLFCLQMSFPAYFRVELSWAKLLGVALMLAPARVKEWVYAGFAITIASALIAHLAVGDSPKACGWAAGTGVLWRLSYFFWRRGQAAPESPDRSGGAKGCALAGYRAQLK